MKNLVLVVTDDCDNVVLRQVFLNTTDEATDKQGRKMVDLYKAKDYETFDYAGHVSF